MKETILKTIINIVKGAVQFDKSLRIIAQHPFAVCVGAAQQSAYVTDYTGYNEETGRHCFEAINYEPNNQINGKLIADYFNITLDDDTITLDDGTTLTRAEFAAHVLETIAELEKLIEQEEELSKDDSDGDKDEDVSFSDTPEYEHEVGNLF